MALEDEKLKIAYEHRLQLRRILIEKGLLGVLVGAALFFANMLVEDFKSDLSRERFLLETRLTALQSLRDSYSLLSNHLWSLSQKDRAPTQKQLLMPYGRDLDNFINIANRWSLLFSAPFNQNIEQHIYAHTAVAQGKAAITREHWPFLSEVFEDFDLVTRTALWEETLGVRSPREAPRFELEAWSFDDVSQKGAAAFFDANFNKWKRSRGIAK